MTAWRISRAGLKQLATVAAFAVIMSACKPMPEEGLVEGTPILVGGTLFNLAQVGYKQSEYFIAGTARSYESPEPLTTDGKWSVQVDDEADFKTRIVVYQPIDDARFNGTVVIEWLNVSGGVEASSSWIMAHTELVRSGYAWVGVSAQKAGIDGNGINLTGLSLPLKTVAPWRYGSLVHPGDKYAYDIFTHAAKAVLQPGNFSPLGDLPIERAIATGESQSADFLLTYVNAIAPVEHLFDAYFIHSRVHGSASISPEPGQTTADFASRSPVQVRDDLDVPVMMVQTETDLFVLGSYTDRQPDSELFRLWEIAGAAHADRYVSQVGLTDRGGNPKSAAIVEDKFAVPVLIECPTPINTGPQHFVVKAAVSALDNWLRTGVAPDSADRLAVDELSSTFMRDDHGNVLGGIRTPYVDAPIAMLSGEGQSSSLFCSLFGTTDLFDKAHLASLYPDHESYVDAVSTSIEDAVAKGHLLAPDGELIKAWAENSKVGK
jgi:hypothetical protein